MSQFQLQQFDREDPSQIGRPNYFDINHWLTVVEEYITCDEVERALWLLDNPPAWYRDHYPMRAKEMRDRLLTQFFTATDYSKDPVPDSVIGAMDHDIPRGEVVAKYVKELNDHDLVLNIRECAPGNYWLPFVLERQGLRFTYFGASLDPDLQRRAAEKLGDKFTEKPLAGCPLAFVCFEMLEHLHNPVEIYQSYLKTTRGLADRIFLSTPKYTFGGGMGNWFESALGHLRAYTPSEFHKFAAQYWPEFKWTMYDGHVMCLVGERA